MEWARRTGESECFIVHWVMGHIQFDPRLFVCLSGIEPPTLVPDNQAAMGARL